MAYLFSKDHEPASADSHSTVRLRKGYRLLVLISLFAAFSFVHAETTPSWFNTVDLETKPPGFPEWDEIETPGSPIVFDGEELILPVGDDESISIQMEELVAKGQNTGETIESEASDTSGELPPGSIRPIFVKTLSNEKGEIRTCVSFRFSGLYCADDSPETWKQSKGLPDRYVSEDYRGPILKRDILDLWQNPLRPSVVFAINKHDILYSNDSGSSFKKITPDPYRNKRKKPLLTAITGRVDPETGRVTNLFLGTSIYGILELTQPVGDTFQRLRELTAGLPGRRHDSDFVFYEEITGLHYDRTREVLLGSSLFQPSVFYAKRTGNVLSTFQARKIPLRNDSSGAETFQYNERSGVIRILTPEFCYQIPLNWIDANFPQTESIGAGVSTLEAFLGIEREEVAMAGMIADDGFVGKRTVSLFYPGKDERRVKKDVNGFYVSVVSARKKQDRIFQLIDNYKFNTVVIDIKDDAGRILYGSQLPEASEMGNAHKRADIASLVAHLKEKGIYTIARQVVFKDPYLFRYKNGKYAIRDRFTKLPWTGEGDERWVDPYSTWVQDYNIRIAQEAASLGFNEIQFDYIRFPTDGSIWRNEFSFQKKDAYRSEALENFLRKARSTLRIPISADIYGYNGIYRAGGTMGQDFLDMGEFLDAISPMHYSSHFGPLYLSEIDRPYRTYALLKIGSHRASYQAKGRFFARPWLQSFKMHIRRWGWGEGYMEDQIQGTMDGGGRGFLWWGPIKEFSLPGRTLRKIFEEEVPVQ